MKISIVSIERARTVEGIAVVVDVLRAFTTAAFAFHSGASAIVPVTTIKDLWEWKKKGYVLVGENRGKKIHGCDFGNSPIELMNAHLDSKMLALRTSLGTQGILHAKKASLIFAASLVVADATVEILKTEERVTFLLSGPGDDDLAAAEYMKAKLQGKNKEGVCERVRKVGIENFARYPSLGPTYLADVEAACRLSCFPFAMKFHNGALYPK